MNTQFLSAPAAKARNQLQRFHEFWLMYIQILKAPPVWGFLIKYAEAWLVPLPWTSPEHDLAAPWTSASLSGHRAALAGHHPGLELTGEAGGAPCRAALCFLPSDWAPWPICHQREDKQVTAPCFAPLGFSGAQWMDWSLSTEDRSLPGNGKGVTQFCTHSVWLIAWRVMARLVFQAKFFCYLKAINLKQKPMSIL